MSQLINAELVDLDLRVTGKDQAARSLAERMVSQGRVTDLEGFLADVAAREAQMPTGLDGGIGIPHCRSVHVTEPTLAFGRLTDPVDFGAPDGPADLVFLIAAPDGADSDHLTILSALARQLMDEAFTGALRTATGPEHVAALIRGDSVPTGPAAAPAEDAAQDAAGDDAGSGAAADGGDGEPRAEDGQSGADGSGQHSGEAHQPDETPAGGTTAPEAGEGRRFRIVAVTSCPTGIAHTYMAAEALERAAADAGVDLTVETQGSAGFERLDRQTVAEADGVILAHDVEVREKERFAGKPCVDVGVKAAVSRAAELIAEVRAAAEDGEQAAPTAPGQDARGPAPMDKDTETGDGYGTRLRKWLMTGVSYMVPFVAAGGLLIALSFAIGGYGITDAKSVADQFVWSEAHSWAALLYQIGDLAFDFLVPVLAGYIAYGMADRPGLVPGFVGGAIAVKIEAGFLGGLAAGLLAGAVVLAIQKVRIPAVLRGIMPVVVIPLLSSAVVGTLMFVVIGTPIAAAQQAMTDWLGSLSGANAVLLGVLIGLMISFDLGGPVNKVAYAFATGGVASADPGTGSLMVMAAAMGAGMVPPLGLALATTVRGKLFTRTERENGKAAWVLGASFITEGAIPFAAADPLRVIPASMAGGAVTGALTMSFGNTLRAPHGGAFVVPLIGSPLLYLVAVIAGTLVTAALILLLKGLRRPATATSGAHAATGSGSGKQPEAANGSSGPDDEPSGTNDDTGKVGITA
ncbi:fructose-specific PTS transporter subunit EIIC [Streptomyces sp. HNM0574]|uniref:PTS fructose transporter subunit IIABC n=1 Tax=Streptomyces sp. HNM0574 TaxID=2714954 RepID=UPI00146A5418|nr:fructose-specific PTS transporter subunit EIIC [Streptomyces sp. HNM0574]NLU70056.1 PTS transporter subunit EIIA [Streptomyces sp. HNM0574]